MQNKKDDLQMRQEAADKKQGAALEAEKHRQDPNYKRKLVVVCSRKVRTYVF